MIGLMAGQSHNISGSTSGIGCNAVILRTVSSSPCSNPCPFELASIVGHIKAQDEDIFGDDEVYLIVEARSGLRPDAAGEDLVMGSSNSVIGDF